ncbi:hypothetical protein [Corynebacterium sp. HMSC074E01]|uniref:GAP1-N2 domain-containing protein n=1 Tax=Corynebacterium sp. HMSC074E01 TaxID=1715017 RepID=UPI0008A1483D|nr:hypothetical protein [Corynebacterium sp. HMSC074E01]OFN76779.1 hypothetical protein HMPREF2537_02285 [Corynebacterium sp. HMSC074E01]
MGGAFSYASFSRANGRAGGWGVGQKAGDITQEELAELVSFVPTSLNNGTTIPDFPSAQQRAELVRRTAVFALTPEAEKWVTMVSVPAGLDATGRGGNVFTYTSISRTGTPPTPATVLFSPDVPAPFSIYEVDKVQIPEKISARGPLHSDVLLEEFLDGEFRYPEKLPAPFKAVTPNPNPSFNRALVSAMATVLNSRNGLVILVAPDNQAALWIAATAREVGEDGFGFSTFEKAAAINEFPLSTSTMLVVPPSEKQRLAETAIPGNPVVFALDEALPDVSSYEASATEEAESAAPELQQGQAEQRTVSTPTAEENAATGSEPAQRDAQSFQSFDDSWGQDPADFGAPISDSSPFALSGTGPAGIPSNPLDAPELSTSQENPFATKAEAAPSAGADTAPAMASGGNAYVPGLSAEEWHRLKDFDPRWWIEHLDVNRGRSIQLAYLDKSSLGEGLDKLLMSAIVASWVFYFPRDFNLLAEDALQPWENRELEHIGYLTATHFAGIIALDRCERYATGRVAMLLDGTTQLLAERSAPMQQRPGPSHFEPNTAWQHRGAAPGHGQNTGFPGR